MRRIFSEVDVVEKTVESVVEKWSFLAVVKSLAGTRGRLCV